MDSPLSFVLRATEVKYMTSTFVDQKFQVSIALPQSYANEHAADRKYPTIYLLDGNFYFGTITEICRAMPFCGSMPEVIVVGIGYPIEESVGQMDAAFKQIWGARGRDLTPVADEEWEQEQIERMGVEYIASGGASSFLQFMKKELIPLIDTEYRTDSSHRILAGPSFGGLFVLHALFHEPSLFHGYVASSPSLWFGDKAIFTTEADYAQNHDDLAASLFLSVGQKEEKAGSGMVSDLFKFSALLESRKYGGMTVKNQVFNDLNHCESIAPGLLLGIKAVFSMGKPETNE
jgi:uncharacterized protein